eukprot:TRINITY_DN3296_c0_g1_i1.p1 TRINITY_DN3296_c0_g1~~TRINITY_DN3296_c0_g1_i1.p1  ORF type:complete len:159 (-),score=50.76 TRINITY_DN3296_c0_g1_i1:222-698(-)
MVEIVLKWAIGILILVISIVLTIVKNSDYVFKKERLMKIEIEEERKNLVEEKRRLEEEERSRLESRIEPSIFDLEKKVRKKKGINRETIEITSTKDSSEDDDVSLEKFKKYLVQKKKRSEEIDTNEREEFEDTWKIQPYTDVKFKIGKTTLLKKLGVN